jgi:acetylornithine deacetylase/succinyl-diaminopimelate desuccinylase-like protein
MNGAKIDTYLEAKLDDYIAETIRLCAQPSISAMNLGLRECAAMVADILSSSDFDVQILETAGAPVVVGKAAGTSDKTLMFYNHYDVQPADPLDLWTTPPFEPTIRDGALYARGAKDDKGEFIARVAAVEAARAANGGTLPCNIVFLVEGQEEIGSPHINQFVQEHLDLLRCDAAIWEEGGVDNEGRPGSGLGARGILAVELRAKTASRDAHSGSGHMIPSAAWRLTWALNTLKDQSERIQIPGFYDDVQPMSEADRALINASFDPKDNAMLRQQLGVKQWLRSYADDDPRLAYAVFEPTCNIQGLTSGHQGEGLKTIVPAQARCVVDFRLVPDQDPQDIFNKLRAHLDAQGFDDIEVNWGGAMWPYKASPEHPFIQLTAEAARDVYGKEPRLQPLFGGSSPMYAIGRPFNVPIVWAGVGYPNSSTHAPDEHVRLSDFLKASQQIARIVDGFADMPW